MSGIKRKLDIEAALRWCFRDEIPKRGSIGSPIGSSWHLVTKVGQHGTMIDDPMSEPGFPAALGDPHPDALAIEEAVKGLGAILEAELDDDSLMTGLEGFSIDATALVERAMRSLPALVSIHARLGNRPSCGGLPSFTTFKENGNVVILRSEPYFVPTKWATSIDKRGRRSEKAVEYAELSSEVRVSRIRTGVYPEGSYCALMWEPSPESIVRDRAEYAAWWAALDYLTDELAGRLDTITVTSLTAPQRPWLGETTGLVRVHVRARMETKARAFA